MPTPAAAGAGGARAESARSARRSGPFPHRVEGTDPDVTANRGESLASPPARSASEGVCYALACANDSRAEPRQQLAGAGVVGPAAQAFQQGADGRGPVPA